MNGIVLGEAWNNNVRPSRLPIEYESNISVA